MNKTFLICMLLIPLLSAGQGHYPVNFKSTGFLYSTASQKNIECKLLDMEFFLFGSRTDTFDVSGTITGSTDSMQYLYNILDSTLNAAVHLLNDPDTGWVNYLADYFYYDELKRDTADIFQSWDYENGVWHNIQKTTTAYDANGNIASTTIYVWDTTYWQNASSTLYFYDASNNETERVLFSWSTVYQTWDSSGRFVNTFDASHNRLTQTYYAGYVTLAPYSLETNTYNSENLKIRTVNQTWNSNQQNWKNSNRDTFLYDGNNNLIESNRYNWQSGSFQNTDAKSIYVYDGLNHLIQRTDYNGDGDTSFFPSSNILYEYDANDNNDYILVQGYNASTLTFVNAQQTFYYYGNILTGLNGQYNSSGYRVKVYPNPCMSHIGMMISTNQDSNFDVKITDLNGRILSHQLYSFPGGDKSIALNVASLSPGNYMIMVSDLQSNTHTVNQFVKQ